MGTALSQAWSLQFCHTKEKRKNWKQEFWEDTTYAGDEGTKWALKKREGIDALRSAPNRFALFFRESEIQSLAPQVSKNLKVHPAYSRNMHEVLLLASCMHQWCDGSRPNSWGFLRWNCSSLHLVPSTLNQSLFQKPKLRFVFSPLWGCVCSVFIPCIIVFVTLYYKQSWILCFFDKCFVLPSRSPRSLATKKVYGLPHRDLSGKKHKNTFANHQTKKNNKNKNKTTTTTTTNNNNNNNNNTPFRSEGHRKRFFFDAIKSQRAWRFESILRI